MATVSTSDHRAPTRRLHALGVVCLVALSAALLIGMHFRARHPQGRGFGLAYVNWFDAYVYLAMTEQPAHFTVAPWGYRTLVPWVAHAIGGERPLRSLRAVTLVGLSAAATLLFFFLRRRGFGWWASGLGLVAFCLSPPVGRALQTPFVVDGGGIALALAVLLALEHGAGVLPLLVLLALGLQTKELFIAFFPLLLLPLRRRLSLAGSLAALVAFGLAAVMLGAAFRSYWTPHIVTPHPVLDRRLLELLLADLRSAAGSRASVAILLVGLTPLALLGALRSTARPFLRRYGYLAAVTYVAPFLAWLNVPDARPFGFLGDVPRLHLYALPFLIPLALTALARALPALGPAPASSRRAGDARAASRVVAGLFAAVLVVALAAPFVLVDRYRRHPLHTRRDGLQILLACRHTLSVATRLEHGDTVHLPVASHATLDPDDPSRRRWFLTGPWSDAVYTGDDALRVGPLPASVLLPSLRAQPLDIELVLAAARDTALSVELNGHALATRVVGGQDDRWALRLPATLVWRGDNVLTLSANDGDIVIRALALRVGAPPAGRNGDTRHDAHPRP